MSSPPTNIAITGTDGGLPGGIIDFLKKDDNINAYFGSNLRTGRLPKTTAQLKFPALVVKDPRATGSLHSDRTYVQEAHVHVCVYAIGFNQARWLGNYVNDLLLGAKDQIAAEGCLCTLIPGMGDAILEIDQNLSDVGGDVWYYEFPYTTMLGHPIAK